MGTIKVWISQWFRSHSDVAKKIKRITGSENYFEQGWIDSFSFIQFVSDLEDHFQIQFDNNEFQNRTFSTIDGLTKIIKHKRHDEK